MKLLSEAYKEYKQTPKELKPHLCLNPQTGLYLVTLAFSKEYISKKGLVAIC